jgi:alkanesulfonate monooxygenase SsuD/methylene tetrahydromethanopterin reductase-like flavin-dependent oxidoreductase (luciferase family)
MPCKVGVLQFFSWSRRVPLTTVYERAFSRIDIMDRTGYDCVWLAEHHFSTYSVCPSINVMAAHVAARTKNIRVGMAVSLAAFYHPLRLAEEVALVDVLSGGRVNWGAGRGFDILQDPHSSHADIGTKRAAYYDVLREHGFPTEGRVIPTARLLAVGATEQEADEVARAGAAWTVGSYANPSKRTGAGPPPYRPGQSGGALHERRRHSRDAGARAGQNPRAARVDRARLPDVRATQPPELHALHRAGAAEAPLA